MQTAHEFHVSVSLASCSDHAWCCCTGVAILGVYKWGSVRMGLESPKYAVPSLIWLGACHDMLEGADEDIWQPLTERSVWKQEMGKVCSRYDRCYAF